MTAKELFAGQVRFEVRQHPRTKLWEIYDWADACYPYRTPELGVVVQDVPEMEARAEMDRLNAWWTEVSETPKQKKQTKQTTSKKQAASKRSSKTVQLEDVPAVTPAPPVEELLEAPDEYEMSDDQKKMHEEEILSGSY